MNLNEKLFNAVKQQNLEAIKKLVENGADVNAQDTDGHTALMIASSYENFEIVKFLVESNANVCAINKFNKTAFHYTNNEATLEFLIQAGEKQQQDKEINNVRKKR